MTEVRVTARQEIERTREEQRNVWHEQLGARDDESLSDAIKRVLEGSDALRTEVETWRALNVQWREMLGALPQESLTEAINRVVMTKAERDKQSALIDEQRRLLAAKQTEIGALEAERDDLRKIVEMVHADLGIQRGDHIGEAASHITPEGKQTAEGALPQPGDVVRLVRVPTVKDCSQYDSEQLRLVSTQVNTLGKVVGTAQCEACARVVDDNGTIKAWPLSCVEVVKGGDK